MPMAGWWIEDEWLLSIGPVFCVEDMFFKLGKRRRSSLRAVEEEYRAVVEIGSRLSPAVWRFRVVSWATRPAAVRWM